MDELDTHRSIRHSFTGVAVTFSIIAPRGPAQSNKELFDRAASTQKGTGSLQRRTITLLNQGNLHSRKPLHEIFHPQNESEGEGTTQPPTSLGREGKANDHRSSQGTIEQYNTRREWDRINQSIKPPPCVQRNKPTMHEKPAHAAPISIRPQME